jgi:putative ABC transport system ATP-binding protein
VSEAILSFRDATRAYALGDTTVYGLRSLDLDFFPGEYCAVVGPSGSGKSTLQHLGAGFDAPTSGSVLLMGGDIALYAERELARIRNRSIGFVFQNFNLIPVLSAEENVLYPALVYPEGGRGARKDRRGPRERARALKERARELLGRVGLAGEEAKRPHQLSGGQRQRVAIARALMNEPRLVFADEPTANLDHATGSAVLDVLEALNAEAGATLILATHDPTVMARARRIVALKDGRLDREGS